MNKSDFNIGFHVYCGSNITKLNLQCASLLTSSNNIDENMKINILKNTFELINLSKLEFKTINDAIEYLISKGFKKIDISNILNKIHVAFYCDSTSGYKYSGLQDFKNRFDIPQFRELFENRMFNFIGKLKKLPYFIYYFHPLLFPEINSIAEKLFNLYDDIFERPLEYIDYLNDKYITNIFNEKCNKYLFNKIPNNENEFNNINNIISQNVREFKLPITFIQFKMIFQKNKDLNSIDYSNIINEILQKEYPNGIKISYQTFLELYELQPELFNEDIEKYFNDDIENLKNENLKNENLKNENLKNENPKNENPKNENPKNENLKNENPENENLKNENLKNKNLKNENPENENLKFKNYNPNINNVKKVFDEFKKEYPNSSFQGTKYHTNLMINRNQFLNDFDSKHKIFIDDDDFTCGLEHYYSIYQLYVDYINNNWLNIRNKIIEICYKFRNEFNELNNLMNEILNFKNNNVLKFREIMRNYLLFIDVNNDNYFESSRNIIKRLIYSIYMKMNMYNFPTMCMNFKTNKLEKCLCVCADWSKIMPPYMPINFIMVNDTLCEDVMFSKINFTHTNYFDIKKPIYYYFMEAHTNHWGTWENCSWFEKIHILSYLNLIRPNYFKYVFVNIGRYYYKYDSIIEFSNSNNESELRFVSCRKNRKILIDDILKKYENIDKWNDELSKDYLKNNLY